MKRIMMVLPLAVLLAYCSGPNNTRKTADKDMTGTSTSVAVNTTGTTTDGTASTTDVSDVNTNTGTISNSQSTSATISNSGTTTNNSSNYGSISTTGNALNMDPTDPRYVHFQKMNGTMWTWDLNYPGYDRPTAGTYNSAINGNWNLEMTPELVSAWRQDNSRSLWSSGYAADGRFMGGNTYLSASESFNTRNNGSLQVNGSSSAGTVSSNNTSASTSGLNNNASANSSVANSMNGNTSANGNLSSTTGSVNGSVSTTTDLNGTSTTSSNMDLNSVNYNAANGNMYQLPKFNLYLDNGSFTGFTGCNSISGRVAVSGTSLHFLNTTPSTNIDCLGGLDQNVFLGILNRVDSYAYVGDELQLLQGNQVLLRFKRGASLQ